MLEQVLIPDKRHDIQRHSIQLSAFNFVTTVWGKNPHLNVMDRCSHTSGLAPKVLGIVSQKHRKVHRVSGTSRLLNRLPIITM